MAGDQDATVACVPGLCPWDTDRWIDDRWRDIETERKEKRMGREEEGGEDSSTGSKAQTSLHLLLSGGDLYPSAFQDPHSLSSLIHPCCRIHQNPSVPGEPSRMSGDDHQSLSNWQKAAQCLSSLGVTGVGKRIRTKSRKGAQNGQAPTHPCFLWTSCHPVIHLQVDTTFKEKGG